MAKHIFRIYGNTLEISAERDHFNESRHKFIALANDTTALFRKRYKAKCKSIEDILKNIEGITDEVYSSAALEISKFLAAEGITAYDKHRVLDKILGDDECYDKVCEIYEFYQEITDDEAAKDEMRVARRVNRGRVVGGGFGLQGALSGMAMAGAMNLAAGAAHGAVNLVGKAASTIGAGIKKSEYFNNPSTLEDLANGVWNDVYMSLSSFMELVADEGKLGFDYTTQNDCDECKAICSNLMNNIISVDEAPNQLFAALRKDPYNKNIYRYSFEKIGDENGELTAIADYHHVDVSNIKEKIIAKNMPPVIEIEEEALKVKENILAEMKRQHTDKSPTLDNINAQLVEFDIKARTYKGITYDTREDKTVAVGQDEILADKTQNLVNLSRSEAIALLEEIKNLDFLPLVKAPYITIAENRIYNAESAELFELCSNADTVSKAELISLEDKIKSMNYGQEVSNYYISLIDSQIEQRDDVTAAEICKALYSSDETTVREMEAKIKEADIKDNVRTRYLDLINKRIEVIWSEQDGRIFDDIIRNTDVTNPNAIQESISRINNSGRTESKQEYITALNLYNEKNIKKARRYAKYKAKGFLKTFGIELGITLLFILAIGAVGEKAPEWLSVLGGCLAIYCVVHLIMVLPVKKLWADITVRNTVIHKALLPDGITLQEDVYSVPSAAGKSNSTSDTLINKAVIPAIPQKPVKANDKTINIEIAEDSKPNKDKGSEKTAVTVNVDNNDISANAVKVKIASFADNNSKITAIKTIIDITGISLKEAKAVADNGGTIGVKDFETADKIAKGLANYGIDACAE
ncbi:MAG: hypothetical protein ACI4KR_10170 [Ruminiclostridium sp.]